VNRPLLPGCAFPAAFSYTPSETHREWFQAFRETSDIARRSGIFFEK
jgi:hypothetical protein